MSKHYATYRLTTMSGVHLAFVVADDDTRELCIPIGMEGPEHARVNHAIISALGGEFASRVGFDEYGIGERYALTGF